MEYLDLKRDRVTGRSKGYAYVNYLTPAAAAAAQSQLNGIEYPPGTGSRLKALFAEPLGSLPRSRSGDGHEGSTMFSSQDGSGTGGPPSGGLNPLLTTPSNDTSGTSFHLSSPSTRDSVGGLGPMGLATAGSQSQQAQQQLSARTDPSSTSHESLLSPQSSPLRLSGGEQRGRGGILDPAPAADITTGLGGLSLRDALQGSGGGGSLANGHPSGGYGGENSHTSPQTSGNSGGTAGDGSWRESSPDQISSATSAVATATAGKSYLHPGMPCADDATIVYSALTRPLPDYALTHIFQQCGNVEFVRVLPDERVAMVKYSSPEAAAAAVGSLNGVEVLGEVLQVRASPPLSLRAGPAEVGSS